MGFLEPATAVQYLSLRPGMRVGDFGAGSGAYTTVLLDRVGREGVVYALDALPAVAESLKRHALSRGSRCMTLTCALEELLPFADNILHAAVLANALHAVIPDKRQSLIGELSRVIAPRGEVLVVDWAGSFNNMGPPSALVVPPAEAVRLFRASGFETPGLLPAGTHHYAFVATNRKNA